jgi:hypothetical protein
VGAERIDATPNNAEVMVQVGIQLLQKTSPLEELHEEDFRRERGAVDTL